jgi:hypothetical protein
MSIEYSLAHWLCFELADRRRVCFVDEGWVGVEVCHRVLVPVLDWQSALRSGRKVGRIQASCQLCRCKLYRIDKVQASGQLWRCNGDLLVGWLDGTASEQDVGQSLLVTAARPSRIGRASESRRARSRVVGSCCTSFSEVGDSTFPAGNVDRRRRRVWWRRQWRCCCCFCWRYRRWRPSDMLLGFNW